METIKIAENQEITLPRRIAEKVGFKPGQKVTIIFHGDKIEIKPVKNKKSLRGFLKGIDTTVIREKDRL